jgi:hypothetical protein
MRSLIPITYKKQIEIIKMSPIINRCESSFLMVLDILIGN